MFGNLHLRPRIMSILARQWGGSNRAASLAGIIHDYRLLAVQAADNRPYSDDDKIDTDYVIEYPGENHYDDAKNKRDNSP